MASGRSRSRIVRLAAAVTKFLVISAAFVGIFLASGYFTMRLALSGRSVSVPDVTGLTVPEAQQQLYKQKLFLESSAERYDDRVEKGRILAQDPPVSAGIKEGRKVKVVTSLGPRVFKIPDLRGQSERAAVLKLQEEGLKVGHVAYTHTNLGALDTVVSQDPQATGESLGEGGVSLLVSKGGRESVYVMPDLRGLAPEKARGLLEPHGIRIGSVRRERGDSGARGTVTRQFPEAGYPVTTGDIVSLVVGE